MPPCLSPMTSALSTLQNLTMHFMFHLLCPSSALAKLISLKTKPNSWFLHQDNIRLKENHHHSFTHAASHLCNALLNNKLNVTYTVATPRNRFLPLVCFGTYVRNCSRRPPLIFRFCVPTLHSHHHRTKEGFKYICRSHPIRLLSARSARSRHHRHPSSCRSAQTAPASTDGRRGGTEEGNRGTQKVGGGGHINFVVVCR